MEKNLYLLNEQIMNGTVTMRIVSTGIQAETFEEAVKKVKELPGLKKGVTIGSDTIKEFSYVALSSTPGWKCYGRMENQALKII